MKIAVGADHAGWKEKKWLVEHLRRLRHEVTDFGTDSEEPCDYADYAVMVAHAVSDGRCQRGLLVCGTGLGMSMAANKIKGVRAAACQSVDAARYSRTHNDANVLCVGSRLTSSQTIREMVDVWLASTVEGGRHQQRVDKINKLDESRRC